MAKSFLLIGIGGSGGKTLRYAEREVNRRLNEIKWGEGMPDAWRFLHIDVPSQPDVAEGDVPADTGKTSTYLGLASPDHQYRDYDHDLVKNADRLSEVAGWRPDPSASFSPPYMGAGQRRVVGRVIALSQIARIKKEIEDQLLLMESVDAGAQLLRLDDLARNKLGGELGTPGTQDRGIIVAASLGGGSGSGIFLDVLEILSADGHDPQTMPILFAADVFSHLDDALALGIEANSLAAVSELISAFEHKGPIAEDESGFLGSVGASRNYGGKRVSCISFFVGRGNGAIQFPHSADVFRSTGKALSAFMMNPAVSEQYGKYVGNNLSAKDLQSAFGMADPTATKQAGSSLGYANVTLGRSLFAEYMAERLAKGALDTLLNGHRKGRSADDLTSDDTVIEGIVIGEDRGSAGLKPGIRTTFFKDAGLHEEGEDNNQVLNSLRSTEEKGARLDQVRSSVIEKIRASNAEREPGGWLQSFNTDFNAAADEFMRGEDKILKERARAWTSEIQQTLPAQTARYVGTHGIPVTVRLLDELSDQLERAASELVTDAVGFEGKEDRVSKGIASAFGVITDKLITTRHGAFDKASAVSRKGLKWRSEARLYRLSAELMREIRSDLIPPLRNALINLQERLTIGKESQHTSLVQQWSDGPVSPHLKPAPNEFLLESEAKFPQRAGEVLAELLGDGAADNAEKKAIIEVISGEWRTTSGEEKGQTLFSQLSSWVPSNREAQPGTNSTPSQASFRIELEIPDLLAHSRDWVRSRESIGQYMSGSLADWLDPKEMEAGSRGQTFVNGIRQALTSAAPLIDIDPAVYRVVCDDDPPPPALIVGDIPMASDHPSYGEVVKVLVNAGLTPEEAERCFDPNSVAGTVEISTFLSQSVHPVVFGSIFEPIYKDWKGKTDQGLTQFWDYRRSRRLPSFIPLSPGRQIAMVRGFIIANLLGQLETSTHPCSIWTPRGPAFFPADLLGRGVGEEGGLLPALLETLPLALVAFANGEKEALTPYRRLLELGASGSNGLNGDSTLTGSQMSTRQDPLGDPAAFEEEKSRYRLGNELQEWIVAGRVREPEKGFPQAPTPPSEVSGAASGTFESRCDSVLSALSTELEAIREFAGQFDDLTADETLTVPLRWELVSRIDVATDQLVAAVNSKRQAQVGGSGGSGLT